MVLDWMSFENHVFLNPRFPSDQKAELLKWVESVLEEFGGHIFILSSGTTAECVQDLKWVALSKQSFLTSAQAVNLHLKSNSSDLWLHSLPDFHVGGLAIWARSFLSQAQVIKLTEWNVDSFLKSARSYRATLTSLVPAQVYDLVQANEVCPSTIRAVLVGGGALSSSLYWKARELKWPVLPTYGMTEACSSIATASLESLESTSEEPDLKILPHLKVRTNESGKLEFKGPSLFTAYIFNSGQGENPIRKVDPKREGWFSSQDCGTVQDHILRISGRAGDFIKIGGEGVELRRLREICDALRIELNLNADLAILPVPDERLGNVIHMISDPSLTSNQGARFAARFNEQVLAFERIRKWHIFEHIPRTSLGKLIPAQCLTLLLEGRSRIITVNRL